jgi:glycosyltransferase involved in cell wall biosynthesis
VSELVASGQVDLLHISDQEQAILVPHNSLIPVAVTVHDLFHLDPRIIESPEGKITVGEQNPGRVRKRDLEKIRAGLGRADLLICDSRTTQEHAERLFPDSRTIVVPLGIDTTKRNPHLSPQPRPESLPSARLNLLIIGSEEPRKRLLFAIDVLSALGEDIRGDVVLHKVGAESDSIPSRRLQSQSARAGVEMNWLGAVSEVELIALEQHVDALLFPSVAEGFGYPPLEAMAAGCPVLMSDLGSHNELAIPGIPLPPFDQDAWAGAISEIHRAWASREKSPRTVDEAGLERATGFSQKKFAQRLQEVYESLFA